MKIRFAPATLQNKRYHSIFDVIMMLVEENKHSIDDSTIDDVIVSEWSRASGGYIEELLKTSARAASFYPFPPASTVVIDQESPTGGTIDFSNRTTTIRPLEAIPFLSQPFWVIVENEWYDGSFILWMAKAINYQKFLQAYRSHLFQFRHAGGKGGLARSAEILSHGVWPRSDDSYVQSRRLWSGVILDSDASHPTDDPNAPLRDGCLPHTTFVMQLIGRSIESYLPKDSLLKLFPSGADRQRVFAFFNMSDEQRRHYNFKKGFSFSDNYNPSKSQFNGSPSVSSERKSLYNDVPLHDWKYLAPGFGSGLTQIYTEEWLRPDPGKVTLPIAGMEREVEEILNEILRSI